MSITPEDPRRVGGRYRDGYWGHEYTVVAIHDFDDWRGRSISVRWEEPCAWHPLPCVHVQTVTHGTPWEWGRDRVIADPPPRRIDSIDSLTQTHARARLLPPLAWRHSVIRVLGSTCAIYAASRSCTST